VLVHPQAFFDVPLGEGARGEVGAAGAVAEAGEGGVGEADAQRLGMKTTAVVRGTVAGLAAGGFPAEGVPEPGVPRKRLAIYGDLPFRRCGL
jgi:hypothetical protein